MFFIMFNNFGQIPTYPAVSSYGQITNQMYNQHPNNYYQNFQQQGQNFNQQTNITFVNGIEGAKAFQMSPNSSALLMDSDNSKFYVKSTDNLGVAKISSYTFIEEEISTGNKSSSQDSAESVALSKEEYESLISKISELESKTNELSAKLEEVL